MREVETARHSGKYDSARELAGKAAALDPADSRILAICKVLEQEAAEAYKKLQLTKLLSQAQQSLAAQRLPEAAAALDDAEQIAPSDPELLHLKDDLTEALRQEERKRLVQAIADKASVALTLDQLQEVTAEVKAALERLPTEPTLIRLRMQLEPRLREHENKKLVADVSDACRRLPPVEALARIREALAQLPGNTDLLRLEAAITQRLTREQREQQLAEHMAKARALLEDHLYLETVKVLELCEREGFSSPEMTELLNLSRSAAAERISQDLVERSFLEAKRLLEEENYEEVLKLLPPVLNKVEEPGLRRQLEEATQKQKVLEKSVDQVLADVQRLQALGLFDAAVGLIRAEPAGVRQARRVQAALESCTAALEMESARLASIGAVYASLNQPQSVAAFAQLPQLPITDTAISRTSTAAIEQRLGARLQLTADQQLTQAIEAARQALAGDDAAQAEAILKDASPWQSSATPQVQSDWKTVESEVAAAKKVLRFKKVLRR
jgi:hypothetical protein